jgi:hypothetical protein
MRKKKLRAGEFYKDLDEAKQSPSFSCAALAVVFLLILVILEAGLFYFGKKLRSSDLEMSATIPNTASSQTYSKVESAESVDIVIPEAVFCSKLAVTRSSDSLSCKIDSEGIFLTGKANFLSFSNMTFKFLPKIVDARLTFELVEVKIGEISAPKFLSAGLSKTVSKSISSNYADLDSLELISVYLQDGIMTLEAKKPL